ncbi:hypothetical protein G9A89_005937 [Geosiphon pyriformis]|nr:hypothetical protein G9A89_005937 [Geosiphon pyriformis]
MDSIGVCGGAVAYFLAVNVSVGIKIHGLLSLTLAELQVITLVLNCVSTLHQHLLVVKRKRLYNHIYPSVACIQCGVKEDSNHMFLCTHDANTRNDLLSDTIHKWSDLVGTSANSGVVIHFLYETRVSGYLYTVLAKRLAFGFLCNVPVVGKFGV